MTHTIADAGSTLDPGLVLGFVAATVALTVAYRIARRIWRDENARLDTLIADAKRRHPAGRAWVDPAALCAECDEPWTQNYRGIRVCDVHAEMLAPFMYANENDVLASADICLWELEYERSVGEQ